MRGARGFGLEVYLIALLVGGAALTGAYFYGRHDGAALELAKWQARELEIQDAFNKRLQAAQQALITEERRRASELAMVSHHYQGQLRSLTDEKNRVIAGLRDGTRRLYIDARCPPGGDAVPGAPAAAGGRDGRARAELSQPAADFLVAHAVEADAVVVQLAACQAVVRADRQR